MENLGWASLSHQQGIEPTAVLGNNVNEGPVRVNPADPQASSNGHQSSSSVFVEIPPATFAGPTLEPPSGGNRLSSGMAFLPTFEEGSRGGASPSPTSYPPGQQQQPPPSLPPTQQQQQQQHQGGHHWDPIPAPANSRNGFGGMIGEQIPPPQQHHHQHPPPQYHPPAPPPTSMGPPLYSHGPAKSGPLSIGKGGGYAAFDGGGGGLAANSAANGLPGQPTAHLPHAAPMHHHAPQQQHHHHPSPVMTSQAPRSHHPQQPPQQHSSLGGGTPHHHHHHHHLAAAPPPPPNTTIASDGATKAPPINKVTATSAGKEGRENGKPPLPQKPKASSHEELLARLQKFKPGWTRQLPGLAGVTTLSREDFAHDRQEMSMVITQKPPGEYSEEESEDYEEEGDEMEEDEDMDQEEDEAIVLGGGVYGRGGRETYASSAAHTSRRGAQYRRAAAARRPSYHLMEMESEDGDYYYEEDEEEMMVQRPVDEEQEEEDQEPPIQPLPVEFVVAEAERQNYDSQYRTLRTTMVRTAQESDVQNKLKTHSLKAVQSMCWKQGQLLSSRRQRIKILQDIIRAFRKRRDVQEVMEATSLGLREKVERRRKMIRDLTGAQDVALMGTDEEAEVESESEEEEEEPEEPILKFEYESLEVNEAVLVSEGLEEGVIENIRRGNVVVRTAAGLETFKLEEVRRKNIAPPGYVPPQRIKKEKVGPSKEEKDLGQAWAAMEERYTQLEKETDRGLKEGLEGFYQESGLEQLMNRDREYDEGGDAYGRGGLGINGGAQKQTKRRGEGTYSTRPVLFTTAPRGITPFDVPLIVTPCVTQADHALGVCHLGDRGAGGKGRQDVSDRVKALRDHVFSDKFKQWEKEKHEWISVKAELVQLESKVRRQKQQTDDLARWVSEGNNTNNKLRNQLYSLDGDIENLKFKHRCELTIANIPLPEGYKLPTSTSLPLLDETKLSDSGTALDDDDEEDKDAKKRRLAKEEKEIEEDGRIEDAPRAAFAMRGRGTSFGGRGGRVGGGGDSDEMEEEEGLLIEEEGEGMGLEEEDEEEEGDPDVEAILVQVRSGPFSQNDYSGGGRGGGGSKGKDGSNGVLAPTKKGTPPGGIGKGKDAAAAAPTSRSRAGTPTGGGAAPVAATSQRRKSSSRGATSTSGGDSDGDASVASSSSRGHNAANATAMAAASALLAVPTTRGGRISTSSIDTSGTAAAAAAAGGGQGGKVESEGEGGAGGGSGSQKSTPKAGSSGEPREGRGRRDDR